METQVTEFISRHGLDIEIFGNSIWRYLLTVFLIFLYYYIFTYIRRTLVNKIEGIGAKNRIKAVLEPISYALEKTSSLFLFALAIRASLLNLHITPTIDKGISLFITLAVFIQIGLWADTVFQLIADNWVRRSGNISPASTIANLIKFSLKLVAWILTILLFLDNIGINVTTLVAGLGIGGIAVALAVQNILGDLLCSLSIALDEPFQVGDNIALGNITGVVERIGIKSTRIRSSSGELIIVSNSDLVKGQIKNFKKMEERRIVFSTSVVYETSLEKLEQIPVIMKEIIESQKNIRFDRSHLMTLGDSAIIFDTVYHVKSSNFAVYAEAQQAINFQLIKQFQKHGIEFAYPTQMQYSKVIN